MTASRLLLLSSEQSGGQEPKRANNDCCHPSRHSLHTRFQEGLFLSAIAALSTLAG